jgi:hypothetical protein
VLHLAEFAALLCVIALGAALDIRTTRALAATDPLLLARADAVRAAEPPRVWYRVLAVVSVVTGVGALALALQPTTWQASTTAEVVPIDAGGSDQAYVYDVRSREQLIPTYAAVVRSPGLVRAAATTLGDATASDDVEVHARPRPSSAVIEVEVTSGDPETARALAPAVIDAASSRVAAIDPLYRLEPAAGSVSVRPAARPLGGPWTLAAIALVSGVGAVLAYRRRTRPRAGRQESR